MATGIGDGGRRRVHRVRFVVLALTLYAACAVWATWPAVRHLDSGHYLARPTAGEGEAAAGDHLQLGWAFWLTGHQLERGRSPLTDPYSFRPVAEAPPNLQGWLLGLPFWPLAHLAGNVWAYNLVVLGSFLLAGGLTCWWLRSLGLSPPAALVGGVVFALAPYRVGQSTGHLLGLVSFLLPAMLLALERRRLAAAALVLVAIPLSGQLHLALGAVPLFAAYAWARLPRERWRDAALGVVASSAAGILVQQWAVAGSIGTGRSFAQVERYSAELSDFVTRGVGAGIEELVFVGWLVPLLALGGLWALRSQPGTAILVGLAAVIPAALALGSNLPGYHLLWRVVPGLGSTRVPERLLPISCLALAALTAYAVDAAATRLADRDTVSSGGGRSRAPVWYKNAPALLATGAVVAIALDLRVAVFGAVAADHPTPAYDAFQGQGTLLELPVFRPDIHFGSVYLAYARQSPRERPQGYSTLAPPEADRWARVHRGLSCGRGAIPADVRWVVIHRGLYAQSGWFSASCPKRVEAALSRAGWRRIAVDGTIATWTAPATR